MEIFNSAILNNSFSAYAKATIIGNTVFFSGQVAISDDGSLVTGGIINEAEKIFNNIDIILDELCILKCNIVKLNIYIAQMEPGIFGLFNEVYTSWIGDHRPARTTIGVYSLPKNANVEIEFIAEKKGH